MIKKILTAFFGLMIALNYLTVCSYASNDSIDICIVFDNSASTYKDKTWCQSQNAIEVFASMINYKDGNRLRIYPMCDVAIGGFVSSNTTSNLEINSIEEVSLITNMYTPQPADTPFSTVQDACEYLKTDSKANEKHLIILTDGEFDDLRDGNTELYNRIVSLVKNTGIKVHYIGYGTATMLKTDEQNGLYSFSVDDTKELFDQLANLYCSIFKLTSTTVNITDKIYLPVNLEKVRIVAMGIEPSINSLKSDEGTYNILDTKYSRFIRTKDYIPTYPNAPIDTSLDKHVAVFNNISPGLYAFESENVDKMRIFYDDNNGINSISVEKDESDKSFEDCMILYLLLTVGLIFLMTTFLIVLKRRNNQKCQKRTIKEKIIRTNENVVFISYKSEEYEIALKTKHILEDNNISCWMAPHSIPAGSDYGIEIPEAISKCKVFLLILSEASQCSEWVPKELGTAISKKKYIIPFHIDQSSLKEPFNFSLINNQRIEAYQRMSDAYKDLVDMVNWFLSKDNAENIDD